SDTILARTAEAPMPNTNEEALRPKRRATATGKRAGASKDANLLVRFDRGAKAIVRRAASLRGLSVSDYVRTRIVPLAQRDVDEAETGVLRLPREDQIAFWKALQDPPPPTRAQRALGKLV